jgi:hypothetical protein
MSHILEQTDDRLVIELKSSLGLARTTFILDRCAQSIRIERNKFFIGVEQIEYAFSEISQIEARSFYGENSTTHVIRLELRSGERRWFSGGNAKTTPEAAARMSAFLQLLPNDVSDTPLARMNRRKDAVSAVVVAIIVACPLFWNLGSKFFLPSCDSSKVISKVKQRLEETASGPVRIENINTIKDDHDSHLCHAAWIRSPAPVTIEYEIYWHGWTPMVVTYSNPGING